MRTAGQRTPGIEALVERQAVRWGLVGRVGHGAAPAAPQPCVAFSQLSWSGGDTVAERVATRLDYGLFDTAIVGEIARQHGIHESLVGGLDERMRGVIDRYVADAFRRHALTEDEYFRQVVRILSTIGQRGRAVLVGRGAAFILSPDHTLRVLVVASGAVREQRCAAARGLTPDQAHAQVTEDDRQRRDYLSFHFRLRQDDPCHYDLVANTDHLAVDEAAQGIVDVFRRRFPFA
jgi:cytidylate kinase